MAAPPRRSAPGKRWAPLPSALLSNPLHFHRASRERVLLLSRRGGWRGPCMCAPGLHRPAPGGLEVRPGGNAASRRCGQFVGSFAILRDRLEIEPALARNLATGDAAGVRRRARRVPPADRGAASALAT